MKTNKKLLPGQPGTLKLLEKYGENKNDDKLTYVMIPSNHPTYKFPYNLEDRVSFFENKLNDTKVNININKKKIKKTEGKEKGYPSYVITIKNEEKTSDKSDINLLSKILDKYDTKQIKKDREWEIKIE